MLLALERSTDPAHSILTTQEQLVRICQIPVAEYLEDVRTLVSNALDADDANTPVNQSDPDRAWMMRRRNEFKGWKKLEQPLAWGATTSEAYM